MAEQPPAMLNDFGKALTEVMDEQGVEGVDELARRLRDALPADFPELTAEDLARGVVEDDPLSGVAGELDARFWPVLGDVLGVPDEVVVEKLLWGWVFPQGYPREEAGNCG